MGFPVIGAALAAGIASHLFYFKPYEHHLYPLRYVQAFLFAIATISFGRSQVYETTIAAQVAPTLSLAAIWLAGVFSSLAIYRLFFNPLNKIPGPYFARLSKFNTVFRNSKLDGHHQLQQLHQKYGKFVRIGPNDISVTDPEGGPVISAPNSKCTKAIWYDGDYPLQSMHTTRDKAFHDRRRRVWAPAFSDKALRGYESRVQVYNDLLVKQITAFSGELPTSARNQLTDKTL
jgi:hypothetical protein